MPNFDLIVIGSGPGGYVAAIKAAQLGLSTALVEKDPHLGGTCLNVGCIPSKALLHSTELFHFLRAHGAGHGIQAPGLAFDLAALMQRKTGVVERMRSGVEMLVKGHKIQVFRGLGRFTGPGAIAVLEGPRETELTAKNILLATGSAPIELPFLPFDGRHILNSDHAIALDAVPPRLLVIGAGAIGLELGSVWSRLGSQVTVLEFLPRVAPTFDEEISKHALRIFKKQGLACELSTQVTAAKILEDGRVVLRATQNGAEKTFEAEKVLVAVGRRPYTAQLGLDRIGLQLDPKGRIPVDARFQTSVPGVYAIGDVIPGPMLAHKAEEEGVACVEGLAGRPVQVNYAAIPNVVYTDPEIASVGLSEQEARARGDSVKIGKFSFAANGRAVASDATDGLVKIIADAATDRLLGVQIIGRSASELIAAAVAHLEYGGSAEDLARTIHAHPTLAEAMKEAALAVHGEAIHALAR